MMATAKKSGRPTVRHAAITSSLVSPPTLMEPCRALRVVVAFSTMTIAASTRTPIEIAIPESDMMFEGTPTSPMNRNETSTAAGSARQTTSALRAWPRIRITTMLAIAISSRSVRTSVPSAPSMRRVRS